MKLEHVKVGRDYMWGDRRVTVRAITDAGREGDPESDFEDLVDNVTIAGVNDDGEPEWQYAPVSALRPLPLTVWAEDIRANYAHRYVPDMPDTPESLQFAEGHLGVVIERSETVVYERWEDVPPGSLVRDREGDFVQKRRSGIWLYWWENHEGLRYRGSRHDDDHSPDYAPWTLVHTVPDDITGESVTALLRGSK